MIINQINEGIVLDHIKAGKSMEIYEILHLDELDCSVAIIKNCQSKKMGKKDILKIDQLIDLDLAVLGYLDPGITVNIIEDSKIVKQFHPGLPDTVENVIKCTNPRCITSIEQELKQVFRLTDRENRVYRCIYCESSAKQKFE